jgi:hypothetical protein
MLISKFNRLIHNKILWGAFAALVSLSMFGLGASFMRGSGNRRGADVGTLFGEPVSQAELQAARVGTRGFRPKTNLDEEQLKELERRSWQRLALLKKAETMGINVSDLELAQIIQRDPSFQVDGAFNRNNYERIVRSQLSIPVGFFETVVRQDLILQKLQRAMAATLWISPDEVNETLAQLSDEFTCQIAVLDFDKLAPTIDLSDDQVATYYEENQERFRTPETRAVEFVQWPVSNFLAEGIAEVDPSEIDGYYDEHMAEFSVTDTNGTSSYQSLDSVTNQIRTTLGTRLARFKAIEAAINLSLDIEDEHTFAAVAEAAGMPIATSSTFSAYGRIEELPDVDNAFNNAVFELSLESESERMAEPVPGTENVYLPHLVAVTDSTIPALDAIMDEVREQAVDQARGTAFEAKAGEVREAIVAAVRSGTNFVDAAEAADCKTERVAPFSAYQTGGAGGDPVQATVARAVIDLQPGEISEVISGYTGTSIAYVQSRTPSPFHIVDMLRPEIQQSIERFRGSVHFQTWADGVLEEAGGMPQAEMFADEDE